MCDQRERLMDYLYDEAAPADRREVEGHLESCAECRSEMRAFRRVREDLLAWDVPAYESVWTPFAPAPSVPWHRQVPAWAMSAAAGLMLLLGAGGGFAVNALVQAEPVQVQLAAAPPAPVVAPLVAPHNVVIPAPVGLSEDEIAQLVRDEVARVSAGTTLVASQAEALVASAAAQQWGRLQTYLTAVALERELERKHNEQTLGNLRVQVSALQESVNLLAQQAKGQQ
jgi:anti-sigma factor RsiW